MFQRLVGIARRREEDKARRAFVKQTCRVAVDHLGSADDLPLVTYILSALVGHTVQQALLAARSQNGLANVAPAIVSVKTTEGRTYVFGDALSGALVGSDRSPGPLLRLAGGGRIAADPASIGWWFATSDATVGSPGYGRPRPPFDRRNMPDIDAAVAQGPDIWRYLRGGGVDPQDYAVALANVLLVTLLEAIDAKRCGSREQLTLMAIETMIAGSHVLPDAEPSTAS